VASNGTPQDWHQIEQVLARFCTAVDRMDFDLLRRCFHPDAHADFGAFVKGPADDYLAYVASDDGLPSLDRTMHQLGNVKFEIDGDVAHAESYVTAYHEGPADHPWCKGFVVVWARYVDRLEKREGRWAIASRTCVFEFARNLTTGEPMPLPPDQMGCRDRTDPIYRRAAYASRIGARSQ
jgi:hypothetical protein